jgi:hypothetical protein
VLRLSNGHLREYSQKSACKFGESAQKGLANVGESGVSAQNGLANVGESGKSTGNGLANIGESCNYVSTQVLAKVHMIRYAILCTENLFICVKHSPNLQDSPNWTNLPNLCNTRQTRLAREPIFLTYSPNLTCASTYF